MPAFLSPKELKPQRNMVEGEGFEPSKAEPSDLQSDPFGRSGTPPMHKCHNGYSACTRCFVAFAGQIGDRHPSVAHFIVRILGMQLLRLAKCVLLPGSMQKRTHSLLESATSLVAPHPLVYGRPAQETVMTP